MQSKIGLQKWTSSLGPKKGTLSSHTDHPHPLHISTWNFLSNGLRLKKNYYIHRDELSIYEGR
jgi:hypothetical protein